MIGPAVTAAATTPAVRARTAHAMSTILETMLTYDSLAVDVSAEAPRRPRNTPLRRPVTSGSPGWFGLRGRWLAPAGPVWLCQLDASRRRLARDRRRRRGSSSLRGTGSA